MIQAVNLRNNMVFVYNDEPCKVLEFRHTHMGRGSADVRLKIRGLLSGNVIPLVLTPSDKFDEANLTKKPMQFLYRDGNTLYFMDPISYEQIEFDATEMGEEMVFLQDGETYNVMYWDEKPINIEIPPKVVMEIVECDPGVKGNSAANMYKSAKLANGVTIKVPLFIEKGEKIRVDTVDLKYVERAK